MIESKRRLVMGIINCTPDSFYTGSGSMPCREALTALIERQLEEGADILDFGGCSTRPGSEPVSAEEEWARVKLGLEVAREVCRARNQRPMLSVDTFRVEVASKAIEEFGVGMINDVTGGQYDAEMYRLIAESGVQYVAMHMRGTPQTMQQLTHYDDVVEELRTWFEERTAEILSAGVCREQILLDPGFGFAKRREQEYRLMAGLERIVELGYPLLVGVSRKSMVTAPLGISKEDALPATTALHWELLRRGATILRVHDVAAARQVVDLYNYYEKTAFER